MEIGFTSVQHSSVVNANKSVINENQIIASNERLFDL